MLEFERVYQFPNSPGFDGQLYHYLAHDPAPWGTMAAYLDEPSLRYLRILLPACSYWAAWGREQRVDWAYRLLGLAFLLVGAWSLALLAHEHGRSPLIGWWFYALPASLIFVDRMTVDHVLCALALAFFLAYARGRRWGAYMLAALAPFARETGIVLAGSWMLVEWARRRWRAGASVALVLLPWAAWVATVVSRLGLPSAGLERWPALSITHAFFHPASYPELSWFGTLVAWWDRLALGAGCWLMFFAFWQSRKRPRLLAAVAALGFTLVAVGFQKDEAWLAVYNYGRLLSPAASLLLVARLERQQSLWPVVGPIVVMDSRVILQWGRQMLGVIRYLACPAV